MVNEDKKYTAIFGYPGSPHFEDDKKHSLGYIFKLFFKVNNGCKYEVIKVS